MKQWWDFSWCCDKNFFHFLCNSTSWEMYLFVRIQFNMRWSKLLKKACFISLCHWILTQTILKKLYAYRRENRIFLQDVALLGLRMADRPTTMTLVLEMGPDPTWAYFWPAVNKRPTSLWPKYFLTRHKEIFFDRKGKNWKIWCFRGKFPNTNPNQEWLRYWLILEEAIFSKIFGW